MFLTPRWFASHIFVALLIIAFIAAGFWQINRLGQRQATNERVTQRLDTVVTLDDAVAATGNIADELDFRRVQVTGQFDNNRELLIANRSREGVAGFWMWTVFVEDDGSELVVNRGFIDRASILQLPNDSIAARISGERGDLTLQGLLRLGDLDARLSEDSTQLTRPDAEQAKALLGVDSTLPSEIYLQLEAQDPARSSEVPIGLPLPDLTEGPHRSYAFQWFTFATIGIAGYGLTLRRIARGDETRGDVPIDEPLEPLTVESRLPRHADS